MEEANIIKNATIRKEAVLLNTYPYSDPSPIPEFGRLYPYNRFDGYTATGNEELWEMVVMENNYIKVWINPSVGGKIWGAIEKATGKEFIYFNHAAKFRDVAMRGPWTSGGMEMNIGIIGHSPSCSAPVDYSMQENPDGSVSCFIGATDWPSRTEWRMEVNLPKDSAYFKTKSWWHNNSCLPQSYYQWNNVGIKASGNLEYIYPGKYRLGHDGKAAKWPIDADKQLSFYEKNDFGEYKSYHIIGSYTDFWGCYWHKDQFGLGHFSTYDDKPGKKIWIWGLSRYGMIWEDLLTDKDGQYSEVQSGKLFNQSIAGSSLTPFKHRSFTPHSFDIWEELWFPINDLGGVTHGNQHLSFFIDTTKNTKQINICANKPLNHTIRILYNQTEIIVEHIQLQTLENYYFKTNYPIDAENVSLYLDDELMYNGPEQHRPLSRPVKIKSAYDFDSAQALCIQAKEWERQRFFERAASAYALCLKKDAFLIEALTGLAGLFLRQLKFIEALDLLSTALSVDTYHAEANYLYGLANARLQKNHDAKDGFSIASQSVEYRAAAFTELAKLLLRENQIDSALLYLGKVQQYNQGNLHIIYLTIIANRLKGNSEASACKCKLLLKVDPINYFAKFELASYHGMLNGELTNSELPHETYIELAAFYLTINQYNDAMNLLSAAPEHAMVSLWRGYLLEITGDIKATEKEIEKAALLCPEMVFPHREEDEIILSWAVKKHNSWKFKYYLALMYTQNLQKDTALALLKSCNDEPDFYPFYLVRANLCKARDEEGRLKDLKSAAQHAPEDWRTASNLSKYYEEMEDWPQALQIAQNGYGNHPENYYLGIQAAKFLKRNNRFDEGIALMNKMTVLPNEGASDGRNIWRETHLLCALSHMKTADWLKASQHITYARTWPENLGVGKPYHVDERLEDYMLLICQKEFNKGARLDELNDQIANYRSQDHDTPYHSADFITVLLLKEAGAIKTANQLMVNWQKQDPDSLPLKWAKAYFNEDSNEISLLSRQKPILKEVLPYEILFEDRVFFFLKKLYKHGLLKIQMLSGMN